METNDKQAFLSLINSISGLLQKDPLTTESMGLFFNLLSEYSFEQVNYAIGQHMRSSTGQFMPKPADVFKHLQGSDINIEEIIAQARLKKTPFGVLASIKIESWNLDHCSGYDLRVLAREVEILLPEWKETKAKGIYTDHEMFTMIKYEVQPTASFMGNLPPPTNRDVLKEQYLRVKGSQVFKELMQKREAGNAEPVISIEGQKRVAETLKLLSPKKDESN